MIEGSDATTEESDKENPSGEIKLDTVSSEKQCSEAENLMDQSQASGVPLISQTEKLDNESEVESISEHLPPSVPHSLTSSITSDQHLELQTGDVPKTSPVDPAVEITSSSHADDTHDSNSQNNKSASKQSPQVISCSDMTDQNITQMGSCHQDEKAKSILPTVLNKQADSWPIDLSDVQDMRISNESPIQIPDSPEQTKDLNNDDTVSFNDSLQSDNYQDSLNEQIDKKKSSSSSEEVIKLDIRGSASRKFPDSSRILLFSGPAPESGDVYEDSIGNPFTRLLSPFLVETVDTALQEEINVTDTLPSETSHLSKGDLEQSDLLVEELMVHETIEKSPEEKVEDTASLSTMTTEYKSVVEEYQLKVRELEARIRQRSASPEQPLSDLHQYNTLQKQSEDCQPQLADMLDGVEAAVLSIPELEAAAARDVTLALESGSADDAAKMAAKSVRAATKLAAQEVRRLSELVWKVKVECASLQKVQDQLKNDYTRDMNELKNYYEKKCSDIEEQYRERVYRDRMEQQEASDLYEEFEMDSEKEAAVRARCINELAAQVHALLGSEEGTLSWPAELVALRDRINADAEKQIAHYKQEVSMLRGELAMARGGGGNGAGAGGDSWRRRRNHSFDQNRPLDNLSKEKEELVGLCADVEVAVCQVVRLCEAGEAGECDGCAACPAPAATPLPLRRRLDQLLAALRQNAHTLLALSRQDDETSEEDRARSEQYECSPRLVVCSVCQRRFEKPDDTDAQYQDEQNESWPDDGDEKENLKLQLEACNRKLIANKKFIEEQSAERETEREEHSRALSHLQKEIKLLHDKMASYQNALAQVESAESAASQARSQLAECEGRCEELARRLTQTELDLEHAREMKEHLEKLLDDKAQEEALALRQLAEMEACLESRDGAMRELVAQLDTERQGRSVEAAAPGDRGALRRMRRKLNRMGAALALHVSRLECSSVATPRGTPTPRDHSEDVSVRDVRAQVQRQHADDSEGGIDKESDSEGGIDKESDGEGGIDNDSGGEGQWEGDLCAIEERMRGAERALTALLKRLHDAGLQRAQLTALAQELRAERDVLQSRMSEQQLRISGLQQLVAAQRAAAEQLAAQQSAALAQRLHDAELRADNLQQLLDSREKQIVRLKDAGHKSCCISAPNSKEEDQPKLDQQEEGKTSARTLSDIVSLSEEDLADQKMRKADLMVTPLGRFTPQVEDTFLDKTPAPLKDSEDLEGLKEQVEELRTALDSALKTMEKDKTFYENQLESFIANKKMLEAQLTKASHEIDDKVKELSLLKSEAMKREEQFEKEKVDSEEKMMGLSRKLTEFEKIVQENEGLKKKIVELQKLECQVSEKNLQIDSLNEHLDRVDEMQKRLQNRANELQTKEEELRNLKEMEQALQERLIKQHQEMNRLQQKHDELASEHDELQQQHDELQQQHDEMQQQHDELQQQNDALQQQTDEVRKERDDMQRRIKELEDRLSDDQQESRGFLERQRSQLQQQIEPLLQQRDTLQQQNEQLKQQKDQLQANMQELQHKSQLIQENYIKSQQDYNKSQQDYNNLAAQHSKCSQEIGVTAERFDKLVKEIETWKTLAEDLGIRGVEKDAAKSARRQLQLLQYELSYNKNELNDKTLEAARLKLALSERDSDSHEDSRRLPKRRDSHEDDRRLSNRHDSAVEALEQLQLTERDRTSDSNRSRTSERGSRSLTQLSEHSNGESERDRRSMRFERDGRQSPTNALVKAVKAQLDYSQELDRRLSEALSPEIEPLKLDLTPSLSSSPSPSRSTLSGRSSTSSGRRLRARLAELEARQAEKDVMIQQLHSAREAAAEECRLLRSGLEGKERRLRSALEQAAAARRQAEAARQEEAAARAELLRAATAATAAAGGGSPALVRELHAQRALVERLREELSQARADSGGGGDEASNALQAELQQEVIYMGGMWRRAECRRKALLWQKHFLQRRLRPYLRLELSLQPPRLEPARPSFRAAALAVAAVCRMRLLVRLRAARTRALTHAHLTGAAKRVHLLKKSWPVAS